MSQYALHLSKYTKTLLIYALNHISKGMNVKYIKLSKDFMKYVIRRQLYVTACFIFESLNEQNIK